MWMLCLETNQGASRMQYFGLEPLDASLADPRRSENSLMNRLCKDSMSSNLNFLFRYCLRVRHESKCNSK